MSDFEFDFSPSPPSTPLEQRRNNALVLPHGVRLPDSPPAGPSRRRARRSVIEIEPFDQPNSRRVRGGAVEPIDLTLDSDSEDEPVVVSENNGNRRSRNSGGSRFEAGRRVEVALPGRGHATVGRQRQNQVARRLTDQDVGDALEDIDRVTALRRAETEAVLRDGDETLRRENPPDPIRPPRIGLGGAVLRTGNRHVNYNVRERREPGAPQPGVQAEPRSQLYRPPRRLQNHLRREIFGEQALLDDEEEVGNDRDWRLGGVRLPRLLAGLEQAGIGIRDVYRRIHEGFGPVMMAPGLHGNGYQGGNEVDVRSATILPVKRTPAEPGFTSTFDLDSMGPITLDEDGSVAPKSLYLDCAVCHDALLLSSAYQSPADRVWVLRCGHMVDQKCLDGITVPISAEQIKNTINYISPFPLDEEPVRKKSRAKRPKPTTKPPMHIYTCPVLGCGREHVAIKKDEGWVQTEDGGAIQSFM